jgi:hypothetical protein
MKIALYITDGYNQIVLTPEGDTEENILCKLHNPNNGMYMRKGSFYKCQGGWVRQGADDNSTIIVLEDKKA